MSKPTEIPQLGFRAPEGATELLLVRHGQSAPARADEPFPMTGGHGDPPLSDLGRWQADQLGVRLATERIDGIYVSNLVRTHQTAAPLAAKLSIEPRVEADLREVFLGEWEGGVYRFKAAERDPQFMRAMQEGEWGLIPGGESNEALRARVMGVIDRIVAAHAAQRIVVVAHGGVIGSVLAAVTDARPFAFTGADNASISHLVATEGRWMLRRYNDTGHLAGELSTAAEPPT